MTRSKHPQEGGLFPAVQAELSELRSVAEVEILDGLGADPERRTNIAILAGQVGVALNEMPREGNMTDSFLNVYPDDFLRAKRERLSAGLYVPGTKENMSKTDRLVTIGFAPVTIKLPGIVDRNMGVVVGKDEHKRFVHSAMGVALGSRTVTRDAHDDEPVREEKTRSAKSSAVQTMDRYIASLGILDQEFIENHDLLWSLHQDTITGWHAAYLTKNLNQKRKQADELIHEIAEIAMGTLNYGTTLAKATHNVIASNFYRRGSHNQLAESWRAYTKWGADYMNAKRGKVNQSINACKEQKAIDARNLAPKV